MLAAHLGMQSTGSEQAGLDGLSVMHSFSTGLQASETKAKVCVCGVVVGARAGV